jgi:hypothetical protein
MPSVPATRSGNERGVRAARPRVARAAWVRVVVAQGQARWVRLVVVLLRYPALPPLRWVAGGPAQRPLVASPAREAVPPLVLRWFP